MEVQQRPWGRFYVVDRTKTSPSEDMVIKAIVINPRSRLSLQYHRNRSEEWTCVSGSATAEVDGAITELKAGDSIMVPLKAVHRLGSTDGGVIVEIARGRFDETDIVRLEDDYGRKP